VTEIAFEVGFNSYAHFASTFRAKVGRSCTEYRRSARRGVELPTLTRTERPRRSERQWLLDEFTAESVSPWWRPLRGTWRQQDGSLYGTAAENVVILLSRPLPDDFRISFEVLLVELPGLGGAHLSFGLRSGEHGSAYMRLVLGAEPSDVGSLERYGVTVEWNAGAKMAPGRWHHVDLELRGDTVRVALDHQEQFRFRDAFPPTYADRCEFHLGGWHCDLQLRQFVVHHLGFQPFVPAVRQGDWQFNAGVFDRARESYTGLLEACPPTSEAMELCYKIGACWLREELANQSKAWFGKVAGLTGDDFWKQQATLGALEAEIASGDPEAFLSGARASYPDATLRSGVRLRALRACAQWRQRGFYEKALSVYDTLAELEREEEAPLADVEVQVAQCCLVLRRFARSEKVLRGLIADGRLPPRTSSQARHDLAYTYLIQGRAVAARRTLAEAKESTNDRTMLARLTLLEAYGLRGDGRLDEALGKLGEIRADLSPRHVVATASMMEEALLLSRLGDARGSRRVLRRLGRLNRDTPEAVEYPLAYARYGCSCIDGKYADAARIMDGVSRNERGSLVQCAEAGVKAGLLLLATGEEEKAGKAFARVATRFPPDRCCAYGALARDLQERRVDRLAELPYERRARSELFCLAALGIEKSGDQRGARDLFEMSAAEDPTQRWPAFLAKERLA